MLEFNPMNRILATLVILTMVLALPALAEIERNPTSRSGSGTAEEDDARTPSTHNADSEDDTEGESALSIVLLRLIARDAAKSSQDTGLDVIRRFIEAAEDTGTAEQTAVHDLLKGLISSDKPVAEPDPEPFPEPDRLETESLDEHEASAALDQPETQTNEPAAANTAETESVADTEEPTEAAPRRSPPRRYVERSRGDNFRLPDRAVPDGTAEQPQPDETEPTTEQAVEEPMGGDAPVEDDPTPDAAAHDPEPPESTEGFYNSFKPENGYSPVERTTDAFAATDPDQEALSPVDNAKPQENILTLESKALTRPVATSHNQGAAPVELMLPHSEPRMPGFDVSSRVKRFSRGNPHLKHVALTFDDGPHPEYTSQILAILEHYDVKATFFFVGVQTQKYPHWVKMVHQAGHEVASHTYDHFRLPKLPEAEKAYQIDEFQHLVEGLIGETPRFLRPPGGQTDKKTEKMLNDRGMVLAMWDVAINDTSEYKTSDELLVVSIDNVRPGSVILAHDGVQATIEMLPELIETLTAKGYTFMTLSQMASEL